MIEHGLISFASDFGGREYYVGAVKGAILSVNPKARIVDASHDIPSFDVLAAAFTLVGYYHTFPPRTVHLAVVDPGVGSSRRGIVVQTDEHLFVGPDNGLFALLFEREQFVQVLSIEAEHYFRKPVSSTFHARDIFGPVAAWLSKGINPANFGPVIDDFKRLSLPGTRETASNSVEGCVIHVDKFGNLVTNFSAEWVSLQGGWNPESRIEINGREVRLHVTSYSEGSEGQIFSIMGSHGFLELAANKRSAASLLSVQRGAGINLRLR